MELSGKQLMAAPRHVVWQALLDPPTLRRCIPGCEDVSRVSDEETHVRLLVKLGPVRARFTGKLFMSEADNARVETIEGASDRGDLAELQAAFHARNALQCGFCTAGMLIAASELIAQKPRATREEIRRFMSGNYCRCTGYQSIVDAIADVLEARARLVPAEMQSC
jgi:xanthine dehydrogenase iron-sulfur cluster and FAD-binding subunit A